MKTRFLFSIAALFFACGILALSLMTARDVSSAGPQDTSNRKQLYFGKEILPDNLLYPVLMATDRVQLETASSTDRVYMQIDYANKRLEYAQDLLADHKESLAISTLTKAEKYLHNAATEALEIHAPDSMKQDVVKALTYHSTKLKEIGKNCTDAHRAILDKLIEENQAAIISLK